MRRALTTCACGGALALSAMLTGCVPLPVPTAPASFLGKTLDLLSGGAGAEATRLIQDISPVIGEAPSYPGNPSLDGLWVIVAICTSDEDVAASDTIEVAVLPAASVTLSIQKDIAAGEYRDAVGCQGRPFHG
jgi:predicted RNA-binding protein with EMAP domain